MLVIDVTDDQYFIFSLDDDPADYSMIEKALSGLYYQRLQLLSGGYGCLLPVCNNQVALDRLVGHGVDQVAVICDTDVVADNILEYMLIEYMAKLWKEEYSEQTCTR